MHTLEQQPTINRFPILRSLKLENLRLFPKKEHRSINSLWDSGLLAKRISQEGWLSAQSYLSHDARHHAAECLIAELETEYSYSLDLETDFFGGGGYHSDISTLAHNFVSLLAKDHKTVSRAEVETQVLAVVKQWALATVDQPHNYLVWTSPPDLKANGYHGIDSYHSFSATENHHSFFYVMSAHHEDPQNPDTITVNVKQLRAWPNIKGLVKIHQRMAEAFQSESTAAFDPSRPTISLIENLQLIEAPGIEFDEVFSLITHLVYEDNQGWGKTMASLPIVNEELFWSEQQELFTNGYLLHAKKLFAQIPRHLPDNDPYWSSDEYGALLTQLDFLFTTYDSRLRLWIERNNTNPEFDPLGSTWLKFKRMTNIVNRYLRSQAEEDPDPAHIDIAKFNTLYDLLNKDKQGYQLSEAERQFVVKNVANTFALDAGFLSMAQCGVVAPFTAPISILKMANTLPDVSTSLHGVAKVELLAGSFSQLDMKEQKVILNRLIEIRDTMSLRQEIVLSNGETWIVPKTWLVGLGCDVDPETGLAWGPCVDPETGKRIYLDDDTESLQMSVAELDLLIQKLSAEKIETAVFESITNEEDKHKARVILDKMYQVLFKPLSVTEFIAGGATMRTEMALQLPQIIQTQLQNSLAPIKTLALILEQLMVNQTSPNSDDSILLDFKI